MLAKHLPFAVQSRRLSESEGTRLNKATVLKDDWEGLADASVAHPDLINEACNNRVVEEDFRTKTSGFQIP